MAAKKKNNTIKNSESVSCGFVRVPSFRDDSNTELRSCYVDVNKILKKALTDVNTRLEECYNKVRSVSPVTSTVTASTNVPYTTTCTKKQPKVIVMTLQEAQAKLKKLKKGK